MEPSTQTQSTPNPAPLPVYFGRMHNNFLDGVKRVSWLDCEEGELVEGGLEVFVSSIRGVEDWSTYRDRNGRNTVWYVGSLGVQGIGGKDRVELQSTSPLDTNRRQLL